MKKSNLTVEQEKQIWYMYNWCIAIEEYYEKLIPEDYTYDWRSDFGEPKMTKSELKDWQMAYDETFEETQNLSPDQYKKLDLILKEKFGQGLFEADKKHIKRINKIVEKNKITNEEHYYLLREYYERIWDMPEQKETAEKINDMIFAFEEKNKPATISCE